MTPDNFNLIAENNGIKLLWNKIDWWEQFANGNINISNEQFYKLLFNGMEKGNVYIITDECFKDGLAYKIETRKLFDFINYYDKINKIEFLEPADYIFILTEENILIIIHHEGYYTKYKWKIK